jgi:phosphatidylinositol/phosphatidylcholine transfer protein
MLQNLVVEYEKAADPRLPAASRKSGYLIETFCTIMDAKGVALTSVRSVMGYLNRASGISQNYYPERLGKLYIINAPWGFSSVFSLIKRFLDPVTVAKISVLGSGYESELLAQIPAENLPKYLGGRCDCEGGCMFSDKGPWQDPQWYRPAKWEQKEGEEEGIKATTSTSDVEGEAGQSAPVDTGTKVEGAEETQTDKTPTAA